MRIEKRLVLGMVAGLSACGGGGAASPGSAETAGGDLSLYEGPITSQDVELGMNKFVLFCDDCHPDGEAGDGPSLVADTHTPAQVRKQVREGSGKMRPFSAQRLNDADLEAVLAYLQSIHAVQ